MKAATQHQIQLGRRHVYYRVVRSDTARKLRVRVGIGGVEVVHPKAREVAEVEPFLRSNAAWIVSQLDRVDRLRSVRKPRRSNAREILYRGTLTQVRMEKVAHRRGANRVACQQGCLVITRGLEGWTPPGKSLENWLRRQAREEIKRHLASITRRLQRFPRKVYVMGQRTKWGNCSSLRNLSFNWRLIMAPDYVLRYLVTHEAVHLAVPDHSKRFWLTVQSLCPEMEKAKHWLRTNGHQLLAGSLPVLL